MSGVVNAVTKDGSNKFSGSFSTGFSEYITGNSNIFIGLDKFIFNEIKIINFIKWTCSKDSYSFNVRDQNNRNHLNGIADSMDRHTITTATTPIMGYPKYWRLWLCKYEQVVWKQYSWQTFLSSN